MKLRFLILFLIITAIGLSCAPKKIDVGTALEKTAEQVVTPEARFALAEKLFKDKIYTEAAAAYLEFAADFPDHPQAPESLMRAGAAYFLSGEYSAAREVYRRVPAGYPETRFAEDARVEIVLTYYYDGKFEELLARAVSLLKDTVSETHRLKLFSISGDAYMAMDSPVDAAYAYARAYEIARDQAEDELYERLKSALRLMQRPQISSLTDRLESPGLKALVDELANALIYKRFSIGCLLPLSGRYETYGQSVLDGVQLALSRSAEAGANPLIEIIIKNTQSDPAVAVRAVEELYESGVAAILGPIVTAEPAARAAQERHLPIITFTQKEPVTEIGDFVFRNFFTPRMQVQAIVSHVADNLGVRRYAILYPDEKYGRTFMNLFWDEVIRQGGKVVAVESYDVKTTDFAEPIKKLVGLHYKIPADIRLRAERIWPPFDKTPVDACDGLDSIPGLLYPLPAALSCWKDDEAGEKPDCIPEANPDEKETIEPVSIVDFDAIFIPDAPNKVGLIIPQLAFFDVNEVTLMGTNLWNSKTLIAMGREYAQGAIIPDGFYADSEKPDTKEFVDEYQAAFGERPGFMEAIGFDTAKLVLELINRPDVRSRNDLRDELLRVADFRGATGVTSFDYNGDVHKPIFLIKIKGGKFIEIK